MHGRRQVDADRRLQPPTPGERDRERGAGGSRVMRDRQARHTGDLPPCGAADRHRAENNGQQDRQPAPAHPIRQGELGRHVETGENQGP